MNELKRTISVLNFENGKIEDLLWKQSQLLVSNQAMTNPCGSLAVIFCDFISHSIGHETINIPEIFSGVHGFTGKTVNQKLVYILSSTEDLMYRTL